MRFFRNNNIDPNSPGGKGYIGQQITCKAIKVKNLNIENDNFSSPIDHNRDMELGILESKYGKYNYRSKSWIIDIESLKEKEFDNIIIYCVSQDLKNIERVYIIHWEEIIKRKIIAIYKNPSNRNGRCPNGTWYEKYRVDEKLYNDAYHNLNENDLKILRNAKSFLEYINNNNS